MHLMMIGEGEEEGLMMIVVRFFFLKEIFLIIFISKIFLFLFLLFFLSGHAKSKGIKYKNNTSFNFN